MTPIAPELEAQVCALEAAADRFAREIATHPGEADSLWLRVNSLRDRILYAWAGARDEAAAERRRRVEEHERRHFARTRLKGPQP